MKNKLHIIKTGGKLLEDEALKGELLKAFSSIKGKKILVHGGGRSASDLCKKLGIPVKMFQGRRITDAETLKVATMVYAGLISKSLVAHLQALGVNAIGLCGADLNLILSEKRPVEDIDFGLVGDIRKVNIASIQKLLESGFVPVISAITHDGNGQLLNTNADTIAASIASALSPYYDTSLKFCFEQQGVLHNPEKGTTIIKNLDKRKFNKLQLSGAISNGMIPKLHNGFMALQANVNEVFVCGVSGLVSANGSKGTKLCLSLTK